MLLLVTMVTIHSYTGKPIVLSQVYPIANNPPYQVKEALDTATIRRAAVKIMKKKKLRKIPSGEENMKREIALLKKLSKTPHPNVIELFDVQCKPEKEKTYLFMTFCCCSLQV